MFDRGANIALITETMKLQERLLVPFHDSSQHSYREIKGTCIICGWLHTEDTPRLSCCGHTLREHVEEWQERMKYLKEYITNASEEELSKAEASLKSLMFFIIVINTHLKEGENIREPYSQQFPHNPTN